MLPPFSPLQWSVVVPKAGGPPTLRLQHVRTLRMADDVLCVKVSPDGKLLAVSLLDATIKVRLRDFGACRACGFPWSL